MIRNIFESKGFKKELAYEQLHTTKYGTIGIRFSKDIMTMYVADDDFNYEELKEDIEDKGIYDVERDILEPLITNGWIDVRPEDIGAMTDAPIISNDFEYDEELDKHIYYTACAYMDYQIKSFAEELSNNKEAIWQYEKLIDETNNSNEVLTEGKYDILSGDSNEVLTEANSGVTYDYSGYLSPGALKVCDKIEWEADTVEEAWKMVKESDYYNEIIENVTFKNCINKKEYLND